MAEGGSSGGDRDAPAAATVVLSGHEAMRTAWSRHPAAVARLPCQTTLIGHNDTLPAPCPSVYANPACPAADPCDLLRLLHGPHRVACRLLMILLSQQGFAAGQVADLLGYHPSTVLRWIHRYHRHGTSGLAD
jgi:hypothetical protein